MIALLVALACGDIGSPTRNDFYEWRLIVPTAGGPDTVSFHWTQDRLPVRIWVAADEAPDLPAPVPPRKPRDCLGVTWSEPHLWAAMRAQVDAGRRRRAAHLAARPRSRPCFAPDPPA